MGIQRLRDTSRVTDGDKSGSAGGLHSVACALDILRMFSVDHPTLGITEAANHLHIAKSTAHRLMGTLMQAGFLYQNPRTRRYHLGIAVLGLSGIMTADSDVWMAAAPYLTELTMKTGEASHLAVLDGLHVVYLHKVESTHPVKILTHLGRRNPSHATSSGKLLLAYADPRLVEEVVNHGLDQFTKTTITDPAQLRMELQDIRQKGFAVSHEELREQVTSISAPVFNHHGRVVAAVNIVAPSSRLSPANVEPRVRAVCTTAHQIARDLGYRPPCGSTRSGE